jgi:hypothetical protein
LKHNDNLVIEMAEKHSPLPWKVQPYAEGEDGVGIISLRDGGDNPSNGVVAIAAMFPTEMDAGDPSRAQANAELIVRCVNASLAQRQPVAWRYKVLPEDSWSVTDARGDLPIGKEATIEPLYVVAPAEQTPGSAILKQADELHDLGFEGGWDAAIDECVNAVEEYNPDRKWSDDEDMQNQAYYTGGEVQNEILGVIRALAKAPRQSPAAIDWEGAYKLALKKIADLEARSQPESCSSAETFCYWLRGYLSAIPGAVEERQVKLIVENLDKAIPKLPSTEKNRG